MIKPSDVTNLIDGTVNYYVKVLPKYQQQQVELRQFLCSTCNSAGKCKICNCKTPQMFYAPLKQDSESKWAEFMSEAQWNSLVNNIDSYYEFIKNLPTTDV